MGHASHVMSAHVMPVAITSINHLLVIYFFMYILSPRTNNTLENYYGDEEESC